MHQDNNAAPLLQVRGLAWGRGRRTLLAGIDLELHAGESVALLGPNGAGKSSLIRLLAGEFPPVAGSIQLHGRALAAWPRRELAGFRAVLPQQHAIGFPLTVAEVVALGLPGAARGNRQHPLVAELLAWLGVAQLQHRRFPTLSGGEQQRVQLARVLAQVWHAERAPLLLLDECTSALDPAHQHRVLAAIHTLTRRGFGALWAVHDLNLAARYADRVLLFCQGRLVAHGRPAEVLTPAHLAAVYGVEAEVGQDAAGRLYIQTQSCMHTPVPPPAYIIDCK